MDPRGSMILLYMVGIMCVVGFTVGYFLGFWIGLICAILSGGVWLWFFSEN